ncbi:2Fe-2S iron-sulfur cluster-binding protein [Planifilum fimeticola]|uniref:2Fe-2S iron-sulfur cluster-binding protein n=1 Tax=Planifilum fimeticola TaxID=201975 RepID=UPI0014752EF3
MEAIAAGVLIPFRCTTGRCGDCIVRVLGGGENIPPLSAQESYRSGDRVISGFRLPVAVSSAAM